MSLLVNQYSGLVTGGLGLAACSGLITMGFHVFGPETSAPPPPPPPPPPRVSGGGGVSQRGQALRPNWIVPLKYNSSSERIVRVHISVGEASRSKVYMAEKRPIAASAVTLNLSHRIPTITVTHIESDSKESEQTQ